VVFSSYTFLFVFLPLALLVYFLTPARARSLVLTIQGYVFYGWWNPWFTLLMLASTALDYVCGLGIAREGASPAQRKAAMLVSVIANLALLGFFKYATFFAASATGLMAAMGFPGVTAPDFLTHIVLPVGISFYTFQSMSYSIDLYRGHAAPAKNFIDFACYVSLFPQLVAGPIVRYASIADQLHTRCHTLPDFVGGLTRFHYGFAKKILLANPMGVVADTCFEAGQGSLTAGFAWLGAAAYAMQIYFDFSAYSDMALGLGRLFGFHFPENFRSPYHSRSFTEFWQRWHISLSTFLRDYLYIPLGGNRLGPVRTYMNLLTVMLLGGLWHGAQWTFVVWGALHGIFLVGERAWKQRGWPSPPSWVALPLTFALLLITWVLFRSPSLAVALDYLATMFGAGSVGAASGILGEVLIQPGNGLLFLIAGIVVWIMPRTDQWLERMTFAKAFLGILLLLVSVRVMGLQGHNPFLYFQF
jgi:alginate O-acetyltransferase complex protein AlgI